MTVERGLTSSIPSTGSSRRKSASSSTSKRSGGSKTPTCKRSSPRSAKVLEQAEKAKAASEAVSQAKAQAAATEAQLRDIEASISGELLDIKVPSSRLHDISVGDDSSAGDDSLGHEKPTVVMSAVKKALRKAGLLRQAQALYTKIAAGQALGSAELAQAQDITRALRNIKVVHGDLVSGDETFSGIHGAFVGACILGNIAQARKRNAVCGKVAHSLASKMEKGQKLSDHEKEAAAALIVDTDKLRRFTASHVSGAAFVGLDNAKKLRKCSFIGAAKSMAPEEKKMLDAIVKLAKAGNPRAIHGLSVLRKSGMIMGNDCIGLSFGKIFKYATAPVWLPAKGIYKGVRWTGKKAGLWDKNKGASPEQARLARMQAAAKRRAAAQARARAADASSEAELRAQEAIASAAEAEADAADAEALSQEAAMRTKEVEADPSTAQSAPSEDSSEGEFVGADEILGGTWEDLRRRRRRGNRWQGHQGQERNG